jgi:hypothetical protein
MMISFARKFIFIANTKTASTTIEFLLRPCSDISIIGTRYGKHMPYSMIVKNFAFIFNKSGIPVETYFRFGVIREPLDWIVSWYNYRNQEQLLSGTGMKTNSCKGIDFKSFAEEVMMLEDRRQFAKVGSQRSIFCDANGKLGVDYLIPLQRVNTDLLAIGKALGLRRELVPEKRERNVSPKIISVRNVDPDLAGRLRQHFAKDVALFKMAVEGGFGDVNEIIREKLV